jgi:hypothetical protein
VTAHLQDDHILVLTGAELIEANKAFQWYIENQKHLNGGAPRMAAWAPLARRGANVTKAMFAGEPRPRTLEIEEAESAPEGDRAQEMNAAEVAEFLGYKWAQSVRRIRHKIGGVLREKPEITFERDAVIAYKMHRDTERST